MSYEQERVKHGFKRLLDELQANIDAERGAKRPPVPAPTSDQLRDHYAHYDLQMKPKPTEEDAA